MKNKTKGIIFYIKKIKDNDLYIKILSDNDEIIAGLVYGGNSSKKKSIFQNGYFIEFSAIKRNINSPFSISAEITKPFIFNIINDKFKSFALLSILSLINISIIEGQKINRIYSNLFYLIDNMNQKKQWIILYCEWLFKLLQIIGYEIDYKKNLHNLYFDLSTQDFVNVSTNNTLEFPHNLFINQKGVNFKNINTIFLIFESIFSKNHLNNIAYKMPLNFTNFKNNILKYLRNKL